MRGLSLLLVLLLWVFVVSAATVIKEDVGLNQSVMVGGKEFLIVSVQGTTMKVTVDGQGGILILGETTAVNQLDIFLENLTAVEDFVKADLHLTVLETCGNKLCRAGETVETCCTDCGCPGGTCLKNVCLLDACTYNSDCLGEDFCTLGTCTGTPRSCRFENITTCLAGDQCCPSVCTPATDADCSGVPKAVGKCLKDQDCQDEQACTQDTCDEDTGLCRHAVVAGCASGSDCVPVGQALRRQYCSDTGWVSVKPTGEACRQEAECLTGTCVEGACGKGWEGSVLVVLLSAAITAGLGFVFYLYLRRA